MMRNFKACDTRKTYISVYSESAYVSHKMRMAFVFKKRGKGSDTSCEDCVLKGKPLCDKFLCVSVKGEKFVAVKHRDITEIRKDNKGFREECNL